MLIKPIKTEADYQDALKRVEALWKSEPGTPQGDELEVLVTLIEAYEEKNYPIDLPNPIDAIRFRLEQMGQDYRALIGVIGQRTRVYEVMRGDRPLSLNMIRNLHRKLGVPAEVLIQPVKKRNRLSAHKTAIRKKRTLRRSA